MTLERRSETSAPLVREVILELLRAGPPHNQLLSPLTPYLALCSSHSAEVIHVPFEHWELLRRLRELEYVGDDRTGAIQELAKAMAEIIGRVAGLGTELTANGGTTPSFVHLRLVISASELALLPWELATAARGFPGEGTPLVLQTVSPVTMTREVRRPPRLPHAWPAESRILFAAATPAGLEVPLEEHLLALRNAIEPWVKPYDPADGAARGRHLDPHLDVLPNASLDDIQHACAAHHYTHVHLLAHGLAVGDPDRRRYGLALHDPLHPGTEDVVSGERLASALIGQPRTGDGPPRHPTVVTVAACQGGNTGAVGFPGGSLAHDLHRAGIPLVVASQFPLTFAGSVLIAKVLYERLLWGEDPRPVLRDLRARLHALGPDSHDWASLVAYMILPKDFERQLQECRFFRSVEAMRVSMDHTDRALGVSNGTGAPVAGTGRNQAEGKAPCPPTPGSDGRELEAALKRLEDALVRLPELPGREAEAFCHRGAQRKRWAQIRHQQRIRGESNTGPTLAEREMLERAWEEYRNGYNHRVGQEWKNVHWAGTQYLSLSAVLGKWVDPADWNLLVAVCLRESDAFLGERKAWACAGLIELYLLAGVQHVGLKTEDLGTDQPLEELDSLAKDLFEASRDCLFVREATRRQICRYVEWWGVDYHKNLKEPAEKALSAIDAFFGSSVPAEPGAGRLPESESPTSARTSRRGRGAGPRSRKKR